MRARQVAMFQTYIADPIIPCLLGAFFGLKVSSKQEHRCIFDSIVYVGASSILLYIYAGVVCSVVVV